MAMFKRSPEEWSSLGLVMIGSTLVFAIGIGSGLGWWIGGKLGNQKIGLIIGFVVGTAAGFREMFRTVSRWNRRMEEQDRTNRIHEDDSGEGS